MPRRGPLTRAWAPALAVAIVATVLQGVVLVGAPAVQAPSELVRTPDRLSYAPLPFLAIPALEASFIARALGGSVTAVEPVAAAPNGSVNGPNAGRRSEPSPSPSATPSPTPRGGGIVPGAAQLHASMTVDRTTAGAGEMIVYRIRARNDGGAPAIGTFTVDTHTPRGTLRCGSDQDTTCTVPGDYDGSDQGSGVHLNPQTQTRVMTIDPRQERTLYTLRVQVAPATLPDTVLLNHAHVDVIGDSQPAQTVQAPPVTVR